MTYHLSSTLGADDPCAALKDAAKQSSRVSLTMVRASRRKGSKQKRQQLAQLVRDWGRPGEAFDPMMRRWQAKAAADAAAVRACAQGGGAAPGGGGADAGGGAEGGAPPAAPGGGGGGAPSAADASTSEGGGGGGGKLLGLHWGIWAGGGVALLLGGALLLRARSRAKAKAAAS